MKHIKFKKLIVIISISIIQNFVLLKANSENLFNDRDLIEYQKEIKKNPLAIDNYYMLGLYFKERNQYDKAIEQFNKVFSIPSNKALTYYAQKKWELKKHPEINIRVYFGSRFMIGHCYYSQEKFDKAIFELNKAINDYPLYLENDYYDGGYFYYILGRSYYKLNDYKNALINYQKGLKYNDSHGELYNGIAYVYLKKEQKKQALEVLEKNIKLNPGYLNGYDSLAEYYFNDGDNELAFCNYEKACKLGNESSCKKLKELFNSK